MVRLFTLLVELALLLFDYLERQRLLTEAELALVRKLQVRLDKMVEAANEAARGVPSSPDDIVRDPANRDRWSPVVVAGTDAGARGGGTKGDV